MQEYSYSYTKHIYAGTQRIASKVGDIEAFGADPRRVEYAGANLKEVDFGEIYDTQTKALLARYDSLGVMNKPRELNDYVGGQSFCCSNEELPSYESAPDGLNYESLIFFYHPDHLGSTTLVTDNDGNVVQSVAYIPYGEVFIEERNGTWNAPYLFNGKELDEETGLYYYGARYLNPTNGMWLSTDPLFEKYVGMSPYNYCAGNPVMLVDPDGRDAEISINDEEGCITIKANIILDGSHASEELANKYQKDIEDTWGSMTDYEYEGKNYKLKWDVKVRVKNKGETTDYNGINNYITPFIGKNKKNGRPNSYVSGTNKGEWRADGTSPASHEFGHILGLRDRYVTKSQEKYLNNKYGVQNTYGLKFIGWEGNIMSEPAGRGSVEQKNLNVLFKPLMQQYHDKYFQRFFFGSTEHRKNSSNREPQIKVIVKQ
ncbi:MAG: RHS repeat-associated core domain-containing protein [Paludibacteraceae bacterium]|nr:RHS repeat-associated core domain-containing protein [Paludibacteraceae bacterium]